MRGGRGVKELTRIVLELQARQSWSSGLTSINDAKNLNNATKKLLKNLSTGVSGISRRHAGESKWFPTASKRMSSWNAVRPEHGTSQQGKTINHVIKRMFSTEPPPRRGWEKFYPKGKGRRPDSGKKVGVGTCFRTVDVMP